MILYFLSLSHSSHAKDKAKKQKENSESSETLVTSLPDLEKKTNLQISYGVSFNSLQQVEQKSLAHQMGFSISRNLSENWTGSISAGMNHQSRGLSIYKDHDSYYFHNLSYVELSFLKTGLSFIPATQFSYLSLSYNLPVDEKSRIDKKWGDLSASYFTLFKSYKNFSLYSAVSAHFPLHTQRFSVYSNDRLNTNFSFFSSVGLNFRIIKNLGLSFSTRLSNHRYMDLTWSTKFGNRVKLYARIYKFRVHMSFSNHSYSEDALYKSFFYDPYRRFYQFGVSYDF